MHLTQEENAVRAGDLTELRRLMDSSASPATVMSPAVAGMTPEECVRFVRVKASVAAVADELRWIRENMYL